MTSPSTSPSADGRRSSALRPIAKRYRRVERGVGWLVALSVAVAFLVAVARLDLLPALAVGGGLLVAVRVPVLRRRGTTRLRTDAAPEDVIGEFASPTPPVLAFQWATADGVRPASDGAGGTYEHSAFLGLRTYSLAVETEVGAPSDTAESAGASALRDGPRALRDGASDPVGVGNTVARIRIEAALDGEPWGAYSVTIREAGEGDPGETVVDVELLPRRRFGLRGVPQSLVGEAYYADVLGAQGYAVLHRDASFTA